MEFKYMKVAGLRRLCEMGGLPADGKKADLVARLEAAYDDDKAEYVEAVPVEPGGLSVTVRPGTLEFDLAPVRAQVAAILDAYAGWEPNPEDPEEVELATKSRTRLNALGKEIDERRKDVQRQWNAPLDEFCAGCKAMKEDIALASSKLGAVINEAEEARRAAKLDKLRDHYEAFAGTFAELVPWERIEDRRWGNKSVPESKAEADIETAAEGLMAEWKILGGMEFRDRARAEAVWLETLNLGETLKRMEEEAREAERIEAAKAAAESAAVARAESIVRPSPQLAEQKRPAVMVIEAAGKTQLEMLGKHAKGIGLRGRFVWGTLSEAAGKEAANG